jgi:hypothetical protein
MKKIAKIAGIAWAFIGLVAIIILFPALNGLSDSVAKLPFMKINPNYTGGAVAQQVVSSACTLDIREPVFDGLTGERRKGFVQLDWRGNLPVKMIDTIDYDLDEVPDFIISVDRISSETSINLLSSKVNEIGISTPTSYGWAVRVKIEK